MNQRAPEVLLIGALKSCFINRYDTTEIQHGHRDIPSRTRSVSLWSSVVSRHA